MYVCAWQKDSLIVFDVFCQIENVSYLFLKCLLVLIIINCSDILKSFLFWAYSIKTVVHSHKGLLNSHASLLNWEEEH